MRNLFVFSIILLALAGCQNNSITEQSLNGTIKIDGSSTVYPITEAMAEEFRAIQPDVKITIGISGTGGGFKKFSRGETDISDASRPIKEKEAVSCQSNYIEFLQLIVGYDGLSVVINPKNTWVDHFTTDELKKMWEPDAQDNILKWNQIRPEWPDAGINLYGPGVASGTYDYFTEAIIGESGASRGDYTASEDDNVLVQGVAGDEYGLGFFGFAYYEENIDKLKVVGVDAGKGAIEPSMETVKNGTYAPLSRPLFIYINSQSVKREEVRLFVEFYLSNAPQLVKEVGYIPLPDAEYQKQMDKFHAFSDAHQNSK